MFYLVYYCKYAFTGVKKNIYCKFSKCQYCIDKSKSGSNQNERKNRTRKTTNPKETSDVRINIEKTERKKIVNWNVGKCYTPRDHIKDKHNTTKER